MTTTTFISNVDEYGFKRPENFDYEGYEKFMSAYYIVLTKRSTKWYKLMNDKKNLKKGSTLKRYVRKGIPSIYRSQVWVEISEVNDLKLKYGVDLYSKKLNTVLDSDIVQSIRTDLPRTFPENIFFIPLEGYQEQLYRILFAFAADNKDIGYCQGLNYVAGLLLLATKNEETTFWLLKALIQTILPDYYTRHMTGLKTDLEVFSHLVKIKMPELYKHINTLNIPWSCLLMKWFVCLYAEVLPTETVLRIWDCLFYERSKILFKVGLTLFNYHQKSLLSCDSFTSFTELFKKIPYDMFVLDCHSFMNQVQRENKSITNKKLQTLRKQVKLERKKSS